MSDDADVTPTLQLDEPHPLQDAFLRRSERWGFLNWGRRTGKTDGLFTAAMCGRGPTYDQGTARWEGVLHGWDVVWFTIDFGQAQTMWEEELRERFEAIPGARLNNSVFSAWLPGGGGLHVRSAERPKVVRGFGRRLKAVIYDEGAHYPCLTIHRRIVRPALMDNEGWALFASSPNAGSDGNKEGPNGSLLLPSQFNRGCAECIAGKRKDTFYSHGTVRDNPTIEPKEVDELIAEYVVGTPDYEQEIEAKLLVGGAGYAFPEWDPAIHILDRKAGLPAGWRWFAGMDWGYRDPTVVTLFMAGPEGEVIGRKDWSFTMTKPYDVGYQSGEHFRALGMPEWIAYDSSMDDTAKFYGRAASFEFARGLAAALKREAPPLLPTVKEGHGGKTWRQRRVLLAHEMLQCPKLPEGTERQPWQMPRLRFHPDCALAIATWPSLPIDPKDPEDVDTNADDHSFDSGTYGLMGPIPRPAKVDPQVFDRNIAHVGPGGLPAGAGYYAPPKPGPEKPTFRFQKPSKKNVGL